MQPHPDCPATTTPSLSIPNISPAGMAQRSFSSQLLSWHLAHSMCSVCSMNLPTALTSFPVEGLCYLLCDLKFSPSSSPRLSFIVCKCGINETPGMRYLARGQHEAGGRVTLGAGPLPLCVPFCLFAGSSLRARTQVKQVTRHWRPNLLKVQSQTFSALF